MTIAYQLVIECANYKHSDIIETSTDYDGLLKRFHEYLGECLMDSVVGDNPVDYVCIETIDVELDSDGFPITDDENPVVAIEYIFNQPADYD